VPLWKVDPAADAAPKREPPAEAAPYMNPPPPELKGF